MASKYQVGSEVRSSENEESYDDEKQIRGAIFSEPLSKVARRALVTMPVSSTIGQVIAAMNDHQVGCALLVREGKLAGIFTERDVLKKVVPEALPMSTPVAKVMTVDPDILPETASVAYALRHMTVEGYRHLPLVDGQQRPIGVLGLRDIVAWICDLFPPGVLNLPPKSDAPRTTDGG